MYFDWRDAVIRTFGKEVKVLSITLEGRGACSTCALIEGRSACSTCALIRRQSCL